MLKMSLLELDLQKNDFYTPDYFLQDDVCRLCWNRDAKKEIIENSLENDCEEGKCSVVDKIRYCLGLELGAESYPKKACSSCYRNVEFFYDFKQFCHKTDRMLQNILKEDFIGKAKPHSESAMLVTEGILDVPNLELTKADSLINFLENDVSLGVTKAFDIHLEQTKEESQTFVEKHLKFEDFHDTELGREVSLNLFDDLPSEDNMMTEQLETKKTKFKKKCNHRTSLTYCNICHMDFANTEKFANHSLDAHGIDTDGKFKCFGCDKKFKTRKTRHGHELICNGLKQGYKCANCDRYLPNRKIYEAHMKSHRENADIYLPEDIFKCMKCSKSFTTKECLKKHTEVHKEKNFICESCGRIFTRQDYLHKHRLTHSGERQHTCPHCGFRTAQRSSLIVHIRKHTGERPYSCDVCSQRCVSSSNLRAHRRRHLGLKNYECSICQKKFGYKISLEEHVASTHERSQSYSCEYCGALYTRLRGLRRHLVSKHGKDKSKTVLSAEPEKAMEVMSAVQSESTSMETPVLSTEKILHEKSKTVLPSLAQNSLCIEKAVLQSDENQYYLKIVCVEHRNNGVEASK